MNIFDNQVLFDKGAAIGQPSYTEAPLCILANNAMATGYRAQIAFHNVGSNGGSLYLDTDGRLKFIDNAGGVHILVWE